MKRKANKINKQFCILFFCLFVSYKLRSSPDITIAIHLYGVIESSISIIPLSGTNAFKPIIELSSIKNGAITTINIPETFLPSEFVLRYDYKEKEASNSYPSEQHIFISSQNLELWVNPSYLHNSDSTHFQRGEKENEIFASFTKENIIKKEKLSVLQDFLMKYDVTKSDLYQQCIIEYEKRRSIYNKWVTEQAYNNKEYFVSNIFQFHVVPEMNWNGSEADRVQSLIYHYFDGIDFENPLILKTAELNKWMNSYVNIYGELSTTQKIRDSLFTLAGKTAIKQAQKGNPKVYGWMVDYFFNGYETNGISEGIKMLDTFMNDPNCQTAKKQSIEKRLNGIKTLKHGTITPDFQFKDSTGKIVNFHEFKTVSKYKLVLFWSADCGHCKELVNSLYPWYEQLSDKKLVSVFALSIDNTETEIQNWNNAISQLPTWIHHRCEGGVNSKEANDYFILSTPTMILVDSKTNKIISLPENIQDLERKIH